MNVFFWYHLTKGHVVLLLALNKWLKECNAFSLRDQLVDHTGMSYWCPWLESVL